MPKKGIMERAMTATEGPPQGESMHIYNQCELKHGE
jgi:hypothetical protein